MKKLMLILLFSIPFFVFSQEIAGNWYGRADVMLQGNHSNYMAELSLKQRGNQVEGVMGYYFKNQYHSFIVRGSFDARTRTVKINDIPIMYYNSSASMPAVHCTMDFEAQLSVSKLKSSMKGYFLSEEKYRYTCPDIDIRLTKNTLENPDSVVFAAGSSNQIWKPAPFDVVVGAAPIASAATANEAMETKSSEKSIALAQPSRTLDSVKSSGSSSVNSSAGSPLVLAPKKEIEVPASLQSSFQERKTFLINEILVDSDSIRVSLYDNGDIDGDTVSVFYNKVPVLIRQGLDAQGINLYFKLDPTQSVHEISLYAENLGSIPPNTALMIIHDGFNRYELFSTSNMNLNGTVRIRRR